MKNSSLLECINLSKTYTDSLGRKTDAVKNVSFAIKEGETFGLVGESGCGKTTLGYTLLNLLEKNSGTIKVYGKDIDLFTRKEKKEFRRNFQIIFQNPYSSIDRKFSIFSLIKEGLDIHHIGSTFEEKKHIVEEIMEDVGLDVSMKDRKPSTLSGGQRQRVAIAQALVLKPKFIVCDEIVSSLDVMIQAQILKLLKDLQKKFSLTYFFISHDLNVVAYMADRIGVMYKGEIVECSETADIIKNTQHSYTKQLFNSAGLI